MICDEPLLACAELTPYMWIQTSIYSSLVWRRNTFSWQPVELHDRAISLLHAAVTPTGNSLWSVLIYFREKLMFKWNMHIEVWEYWTLDVLELHIRFVMATENLRRPLHLLLRGRPDQAWRETLVHLSLRAFTPRINTIGAMSSVLLPSHRFRTSRLHERGGNVHTAEVSGGVDPKLLLARVELTQPQAEKTCLLLSVVTGCSFLLAGSEMICSSRCSMFSASEWTFLFFYLSHLRFYIFRIVFTVSKKRNQNQSRIYTQYPTIYLETDVAWLYFWSRADTVWHKGIH